MKKRRRKNDNNIGKALIVLNSYLDGEVSFYKKGTNILKSNLWRKEKRLRKRSPKKYKEYRRAKELIGDIILGKMHRLLVRAFRNESSFSRKMSNKRRHKIKSGKRFLNFRNLSYDDALLWAMPMALEQAWRDVFKYDEKKMDAIGYIDMIIYSDMRRGITHARQMKFSKNNSEVDYVYDEFNDHDYGYIGETIGDDRDVETFQRGLERLAKTFNVKL